MRRTVLPSGLQVVTERMSSSRTFSIGFYVGVGSRHESDTLHGASHFLEHVLFKGTRTRTAEQISSAIESIGGDINAYTAKELTCFYARVLDTHAELAVDVLADMLTGSTVLSREVDAERSVILDEIAMHSDDPGETVQELVNGSMFGGTGLGRPVIGSEESITALNRQQIVRHWQRHYQAGSVVVAASGNVDHDRLVAQLFDSPDLPSTGGSPRPTPATVIRPEPAVVTEIRRLEQCTVMMAFPATSHFDDRRYATGLLSTVLGGGMSSRLFVEVRERRGLSYGIEAGEIAYSDAGMWAVDWQSAPDKVIEISALVRGILDDVAANGVTEEELERAKGQIRGQTTLAFEGPSARMSRLGVNALLGDRRTLSQTLAAFDAVTLDDLQTEARLIFGQPAVLGVVGPRVATKKLLKYV